MSTATVLVVDTFRCRSASGVDSDLFFKSYEQHVNQLLERSLNAALIDSPIFILVSCNNGSALARPLTEAWPQGSRKSQPNLINLSSEPIPRLHQGPTSLHVLASALGSLEVILPCDSKARVLFLTPWHASQNDAEDGEDWTSVLEEIRSYLISDISTKSARVTRCDFVLVEMQEPDNVENSLEEKSCLPRLQTFFSAQYRASQTSSFSTKAISATEDTFNDLFRQILSWMFDPRAVQIYVDSRSKIRSDHADTVEAAMTTLTIFGNISPAAWTTLSWWHSGLCRFNAISTIPLSQVDPLRLGAALSLAPIITTDGTHPKLPQAAVTENRCLFAALCQEIAVNECGLLLNCSSSPELRGPDEVWLLHCDRVHSHLQSTSVEGNSHANEGSSPRAWESAIMQQLLPNEVLLQPVDVQHSLTANESLCVQSYATPIRSALIALGESQNLPTKNYSIFDKSPSAIGSTGSHHAVNLRAAYTSPWLHQYHLGPISATQYHVSSSINETNASGKNFHNPHQRTSKGSSMPQQYQDAHASSKTMHFVRPIAESPLRQKQLPQKLQERYMPQQGQQLYQQQPKPHGNVPVAPRTRESQYSPPRNRSFSSLSSERNTHFPDQKMVRNPPPSRVGRSNDLTQDEDFEYDALDDLAGPAPQNNHQNSWGTKAPKVTNKRPQNAAPGKLPLSFGILGNK